MIRGSACETIHRNRIPVDCVNFKPTSRINSKHPIIYTRGKVQEEEEEEVLPSRNIILLSLYLLDKPFQCPNQVWRLNYVYYALKNHLLEKDLEWVFRCFLMHIYWSNRRRIFSYLDSWNFICKFKKKNFLCFDLFCLTGGGPPGVRTPTIYLVCMRPLALASGTAAFRIICAPPPFFTRKEIPLPGGGTSGVILSCELTPLKRELWI